MRVWDPLVRVTHWTLAISFFIAYFTEDDWLLLHVWAGYTAGALVLLRVIWGFTGPRHARFTDFLYDPLKVWRYLLDLVAFRAKRYLGHSPAGGAMVIALLVGIAATVWSGLELYAGNENAGPLARMTTSRVVNADTRSSFDVLADEDDEASKEEQKGEEGRRELESESDDDEFWGEIHELLANVMLVLVILHIVGVLLASVVHRENLTRSMVTGYKEAD